MPGIFYNEVADQLNWNRASSQNNMLCPLSRVPCGKGVKQWLRREHDKSWKAIPETEHIGNLCSNCVRLEQRTLKLDRNKNILVNNESRRGHLGSENLFLWWAYLARNLCRVSQKEEKTSHILFVFVSTARQRTGMSLCSQRRSLCNQYKFSMLPIGISFIIMYF